MARAYKRDSKGQFASGGSSGPKGTIAKGGGGVRGSTARSVAATEGRAKPLAAGQTPRLKAKKGAQLVMKEGITSKAGSARAAAIKAEAAERKAKKQLSAAKKIKGSEGQLKQSAATKALDKAQRERMKAMDKLVKATKKK